MAVDWSGAASGAHRRIAVAEARPGELLSVTRGLSREAALARVLAARPAVASFDFSFAFPAWFARSLGCADVEALWARVAADGEDWLAACAPPFWGRPGRRRPARGPGEPELRRAEARLPGRPSSTFQVGGAGAVGTGSLRGMPFLPALREAGFALWPWDAGRMATVLEIYPRVFTGPVVKSSPAARAERVAADPRIPPALRRQAAATEDAFDAALSALALAEHLPELLALPATEDPDELLEGAIWLPAEPR